MIQLVKYNYTYSPVVGYHKPFNGRIVKISSSDITNQKLRGGNLNYRLELTGTYNQYASDGTMTFIRNADLDTAYNEYQSANKYIYGIIYNHNGEQFVGAIQRDDFIYHQVEDVYEITAIDWFNYCLNLFGDEDIPQRPGRLRLGITFYSLFLFLDSVFLLGDLFSEIVYNLYSEDEGLYWYGGFYDYLSGVKSYDLLGGSETEGLNPPFTIKKMLTEIVKRYGVYFYADLIDDKIKLIVSNRSTPIETYPTIKLDDYIVIGESQNDSIEVDTNYYSKTQAILSTVNLQDSYILNSEEYTGQKLDHSGWELIYYTDSLAAFVIWDEKQIPKSMSYVDLRQDFKGKDFGYYLFIGYLEAESIYERNKYLIGNTTLLGCSTDYKGLKLLQTITRKTTKYMIIEMGKDIESELTSLKAIKL